MNDMLPLVLAWATGGVLGALFFGGLWWTVRKALASNQPALWLLTSGLLRMGLTLAGFYIAAGGNWQRWLACLLGFFMARQIVTRLTHEVRHAP